METLIEIEHNSNIKRLHELDAGDVFHFANTSVSSAVNHGDVYLYGGVVLGGGKARIIRLQNGSVSERNANQQIKVISNAKMVITYKHNP